MLLLESEICLLCSENKILIDFIGEKGDFMRNVKKINKENALYHKPFIIYDTLDIGKYYTGVACERHRILL